jgi:hypothetical protein
MNHTNIIKNPNTLNIIIIKIIMSKKLNKPKNHIKVVLIKSYMQKIFLKTYKKRGN